MQAELAPEIMPSTFCVSRESKVSHFVIMHLLFLCQIFSTIALIMQETTDINRV